MRSLCCVASLCRIAFAAARSTSGASVESRSQVMKDARRSLGGGATCAGECFLKQAFTIEDHCDDVTQRVVSLVGWNPWAENLLLVGWNK